MWFAYLRCLLFLAWLRKNYSRMFFFSSLLFLGFRWNGFSMKCFTVPFAGSVVQHTAVLWEKQPDSSFWVFVCSLFFGFPDVSFSQAVSVPWRSSCFLVSSCDVTNNNGTSSPDKAPMTTFFLKQKDISKGKKSLLSEIWLSLQDNFRRDSAFTFASQARLAHETGPQADQFWVLLRM